MPTTTTPRMPFARLALAATALALVLGGCGESSTPGGSSGSGSPGAADGDTEPGGIRRAVRPGSGRRGGVPDTARRRTGRRGDRHDEERCGRLHRPGRTVQTLATAPPPTTGLNAGNDRIAASVERDGTTIDLGEAAGSDPLSTAAREVLDDVQLPETQRTVCR